MPKILLAISIVLIAVSALLGFKTLGAKASLRQELAASDTAKKAAQTGLDKAVADVKAAKAQAVAAAEEAKTAKADLSTAQETAKSETAKSTALQDENQKLKDQVAQLQASGSGTVAVAAPVDDGKQKALEEQVAELQQVNQTMATRVAEAEGKSKSMEVELAHYKGQARAKGLEGQVLAVNGAYNFVVLSLGDRQGVVMNAQMIIFRGDRVVAKVKVTSVEPSTSIADIIPGSGPRDFRVMPGDRVVYGGA
jgi:DNA polymerase III alpha subunit (gram-positive type)